VKIYRFRNVYTPVASNDVYVSKRENDAQIVMFPVGIEGESSHESLCMPVELAEKIFDKIGEYLAEKTVIDIDMIIEKMTQQYEYEQKTSGAVPV
jgi:hypothetical protein